MSTTIISNHLRCTDSPPPRPSSLVLDEAALSYDTDFDFRLAMHPPEDELFSGIDDPFTTRTEPPTRHHPLDPHVQSWWKELLCLKKQSHHVPDPEKLDIHCLTHTNTSKNDKPSWHAFRGIRASLSSHSDRSSLRLPLLREPQSHKTFSATTARRLSLPSSFLDGAKPQPPPSNPFPIHRERASGTDSIAYMDSPRLNASGRVVFHRPERSMGGPSPGGSKVRAGGVRSRCQQAVVRVNPVINVSVGTIKGGMGLGHRLFHSSLQKEKEKEKEGKGREGGFPFNQNGLKPHPTYRKAVPSLEAESRK